MPGARPGGWGLWRALCAGALAAALSAGCAPPIRVSGFAPPTNVVAFTNPELAQYPLRRVVVLYFDNRTPTPEAGKTIAEYFYHELKSRATMVVLPPLPVDYSQLTLEFPLGQRVGGQLPPPEVKPEEIARVLEQLEPALKAAIKAKEAEGAVTQVVLGSRDAEPGVPKHIKLTDLEKADIESAYRRGEADRLVDGIVVGIISRYRNRQGSPLTVVEPASVAYDIYLLSTLDGSVLWQAAFDETQVPLFDNIMLIERFIKGKGVWQTHDTLTRIGMSRVLEDFPGVRPPAPPPPPEPSQTE